MPAERLDFVARTSCAADATVGALDDDESRDAVDANRGVRSAEGEHVGAGSDSANAGSSLLDRHAWASASSGDARQSVMITGPHGSAIAVVIVATVDRTYCYTPNCVTVQSPAAVA